MSKENEGAAEAPKLDPYVENLTKSFGLILTDEEKKEDPKTIPLAPSITLGDAVVKAQDDRKASSENPDEKKNAEDAAALEKQKQEEAEAERLKAEAKAKEDAAKSATTSAPPKPQPQTVIKVVKEAKDDKKTEEEEKAIAAEAEYIKTLTEDQREELEIAKHHDRVNKTNLYQQHIDYYKKVDEFSEKNPDVDPNSEQFQKFTQDNRPKWSAPQRRASERSMIEERAKQAALEEARKERAPLEIEVAKMKSEPVLLKAREDIVKAMSQTEDGKDLPVIEKEVAEKILSMSPQQALEEHPIKAKIVIGTNNAVRSYINIVSGIEGFNPERNGVHGWLAVFLKREGAAMKQRPESETVVNGKRFLPIDEYARLSEDEVGNYWTFSQQQVVDRIIKNGITQYRREIESLEKEGLKREKVSTTAKNDSTPAASDQAKPSSPKAGGRLIPGAEAQRDIPNKNAPFFAALNIPEEMTKSL